MSTIERASWREKNRVLVAVYADEEKAKEVVTRLIDMNFQMDTPLFLHRTYKHLAG
jgi:hypothetical protein